MTDEQLRPRRGRRVTIDLTPAAAEEIDRIADLVGISVPDVFRQSFGLFRLYVNAKVKGKTLAIVDTKDPKVFRQLELHLQIQSRKEADGPCHRNPNETRILRARHKD